MAPSLANASADVLSSDRSAPAPVLRNPEHGNPAWQAIGAAMNRTRQACGLSVKEFSDRLGKDKAQVRRWFAGTERPQVDAVFAVKALRAPFVIALAGADVEGVEIETTVRLKRSA